MGVNVPGNDSQEALRLLQEVPRIGQWNPTYYTPNATPSRSVRDLSVAEINGLLRGGTAAFLPERAGRSAWPRNDLVSELTRRASGIGAPAAASMQADALADMQTARAPNWDTMLGSPSAARIEGGGPVAPGPVSPAGNPPPAARARSGTAVVTPSAGSGVPAAPPAAPPATLAQSPLSQRTPPLEAEPGQRMMEFGLAMLASRSPHFGQTVGEAGQAVIAGDRTRRQENREQQKADTEQQFREAYIRVQETQLALEAEPGSPANLARAATARAALMRAEADMMTARRGPAPQFQELEDGSVENMQTGQRRERPEGVRSAAYAARRDAIEERHDSREVQMLATLINNARTGLAAQKTITGEPRWTPDEIEQRASAAAWAQVNRLRVARGLPPIGDASGPPGAAATPGVVDTPWRPTR